MLIFIIFLLFVCYLGYKNHDFLLYKRRYNSKIMILCVWSFAKIWHGSDLGHLLHLVGGDVIIVYFFYFFLWKNGNLKQFKGKNENIEKLKGQNKFWKKKCSVKYANVAYLRHGNKRMTNISLIGHFSTSVAYDVAFFNLLNKW